MCHCHISHKTVTMTKPHSSFGLCHVSQGSVLMTNCLSSWHPYSLSYLWQGCYNDKNLLVLLSIYHWNVCHSLCHDDKLIRPVIYIISLSHVSQGTVTMLKPPSTCHLYSIVTCVTSTMSPRQISALVWHNCQTPACHHYVPFFTPDTIWQPVDTQQIS